MCDFHLQGSQLPTSTCKFPFQNLLSHFVLGHQVVKPCTYKQYILYIYTILGYFLISQSNHYNIMMASVCTDQYCIRPSAMLGLGQWVEQCNLTMLGFPIGHQANTYLFLSRPLSHIHASLSHLHSPVLQQRKILL